MAHAKGGKMIVCDEHTWTNSKDEILYEDPERIRVKGFDKELNVYTPVREQTEQLNSNMHMIPFVGREREMSIVTEAIESFDQTNNQVLIVEGESMKYLFHNY